MDAHGHDMDFFTQAKDALRGRLESFLGQEAQAMAGQLQPLRDALGLPALAGLGSYGSGGKMLRGALVLLGYRLARPDVQAVRDPACLDAAAAMELFQSGLLIHDDVMDRDDLRRGQPSLHRRYQAQAEGLGLAQAERLGQSMAICVADLAFFLGFSLLARSGASAETQDFCARELGIVALAQMSDLEFSLGADIPAEEEILNLYRLKTGRYSFSLPLCLGSCLGGWDLGSCKPLTELGEAMGMAFQIRDDELGLVGSQAELGKPILSDLRESKKTLALLCLLRCMGADDAARLRSLLGRDDLGQDEAAWLASAYRSSGAAGQIAARIKGLADRALVLIDALEASLGRPQDELRALVAYIGERRE